MENVWPLLQGLGAWNWLMLAAVLLALEMVIPGVHFLWFGLAAAVIGIVALAIGIAWPWHRGRPTTCRGFLPSSGASASGTG